MMNANVNSKREKKGFIMKKKKIICKNYDILQWGEYIEKVDKKRTLNSCGYWLLNILTE